MSPSHASGWRDKVSKEHFWGFRPWRRHSLVLMVAGLAYVGIGNAYILSDSSPAREQALVIALAWFPIEFWGTIFILVGIAAILSARWPPKLENWGYNTLTGFTAGWSATYLTGIVFEDSPVSNFLSVVIWGLMAFLWWAISGLVNPTDTVVVITDGQLDPDS